MLAAGSEMISGISKPEPNSIAPSRVLGERSSISRLIPCTRSLFGSVTSIEPESSMIASMFEAGLHADAVAGGAAAAPGTAIRAVSRSATAPGPSNHATRLIKLSFGRGVN